MNTPTQHTPGPWRLDSRPTATHDLTISGGGRWIATIHQDRASTTSQMHPGEREAEANARLISAAPDLLSTLKLCADFTARALGGENMAEEEITGLLSDSLNEARAAIEKATQ